MRGPCSHPSEPGLSQQLAGAQDPSRAVSVLTSRHGLVAVRTIHFEPRFLLHSQEGQESEFGCSSSGSGRNPAVTQGSWHSGHLLLQRDWRKQTMAQSVGRRAKFDTLEAGRIG